MKEGGETLYGGNWPWRGLFWGVYIVLGCLFKFSGLPEMSGLYCHLCPRPVVLPSPRTVGTERAAMEWNIRNRLPSFRLLRTAFLGHKGNWSVCQPCGFGWSGLRPQYWFLRFPKPLAPESIVSPNPVFLARRSKLSWSEFALPSLQQSNALVCTGLRC